MQSYEPNPQQGLPGIMKKTARALPICPKFTFNDGITVPYTVMTIILPIITKEFITLWDIPTMTL